MFSPIISLTALGDQHTLQIGPVSQVSALLGWALNANGLTPTRTLFAEFQTGTDGTTFNSWRDLTVANLNGLALNANEAFYSNVRITRTGTDTLGSIDLMGFAWDFQYDASADEGLGEISSPAADIADLLVAVIKDQRLTYNDGPLGTVIYGQEMDCSQWSGPVIYINSLDTSSRAINRTCRTDVTVNFKVGVSRENSRDPLTDRMFNKMIDRLYFLFGSDTAQTLTHDIEFNGSSFQGVRWRDFGLRNFRTSAAVDVINAPCKRLDREFTVTFDIVFSRNISLF